MRMSAPFSMECVAKLCRNEWQVAGLVIPAGIPLEHWPSGRQPASNGLRTFSGNPPKTYRDLRLSIQKSETKRRSDLERTKRNTFAVQFWGTWPLFNIGSTEK